LKSFEVNSPPWFVLNVEIFSLVAFSTKHWKCMIFSKPSDLYFRKYSQVILVKSSTKRMRYLHTPRKDSIAANMSLWISCKHLFAQHVFVKTGSLFCLPKIQASHLVVSLLKVGNPLSILYVLSLLSLSKFKCPNL